MEEMICQSNVKNALILHPAMLTLLTMPNSTQAQGKELFSDVSIAIILPMTSLYSLLINSLTHRRVPVNRELTHHVTMS